MLENKVSIQLPPESKILPKKYILQPKKSILRKWTPIHDQITHVTNNGKRYTYDATKKEKEREEMLTRIKEWRQLTFLESNSSTKPTGEKKLTYQHEQEEAWLEDMELTKKEIVLTRAEMVLKEIN